MTAEKVSYDYPEYDFIDFLYLNGYLTSRPTEDLPEDPSRTPFENEIRRIAATLNCHRRKPKELIDPFYKTNFRWVFTVEDTTPHCRIVGASLLRAPEPFASNYDLLYFNAEEGLEEETLKALWKHVLWTMGTNENGLSPKDIRAHMSQGNSTLLGFLSQ